MRKLHIVKDTDGIVHVVQDHDIKDGRIRKRKYDYHYNEDYSTFVDVVILNSYSLFIETHFIIREKNDPSDRLNACVMSGGLREIYRLAYRYSVLLLEMNEKTHQLFESDVIYSDAGLRKTEFDMYAYHSNEPEFHYNEDRLEYEVYCSLDLKKILKLEDGPLA